MYITYLLGDTGLVPAKHGIASQQTGKKAIVATLFPGGGWIDVPQYHHGALVYEGKCSEVPSMCFGGFQDELGFFAETVRVHQYIGNGGASRDLALRSRPKQKDHPRKEINPLASFKTMALLEKNPTYTKACGNRTLDP